MNASSSSQGDDREQRLNAVLADYLKRKDAGKAVSQRAILKAYPDLVDRLKSYFDGEALLGDAAFAPTMLNPKPVNSETRDTLPPGMIESDTASEFSPRTFGRYQLLRPLGEGAMGRVFLAKDTVLDRQVALKVPKSLGTANAEFMARFSREAKAAAALKHPNICSVFDTGEFEGTAFITMDFINGVPLSRYIGSGKLQSLESILRMLRIIADAVGHAHKNGVVHRDLKPGNILVDADLNPHVTDFGLARRVEAADESRLTQEGLLIGTPAYMAPEQVMGEQAKVGPHSDIYSLGVIFFEMLTCRLPFEGSVPLMLARALRDDPPSPSDIRPNLSGDVDELCLKCLKKEPAQRFATMNEVVAAIEVLQDKIKSRPIPTPEDEAWRSRVKKDKPKKSAPASDKPKRNLPDVLVFSLEPGDIVLPVTAPISNQQDAKKRTKSKRTKTELPKASQRRVASKRRLLIGGAVALFSLIAISSFIVILLTNGTQTIAVHVDDAWLSEQGGQIALLVDGQSHTISASSLNGEVLSLTVKFGKHSFSVKQGDTIVHNPKTLDIEKNGKRIVHISATDILLADTLPAAQAADKIATTDSEATHLDVLNSFKSLAASEHAVIPLDADFESEVAKLGNPPGPAIAPFSARQAKVYQVAWARHLEVPIDYTNSIGMKFILIPPGEFMMGSGPEELEWALQDTVGDEDCQISIPSESPQHKVVLTNAFYLGINEVTQDQYKSVMGLNPSFFAASGGGKDAVSRLNTVRHPVEMVSWNDAINFCSKLSVNIGHKPFYQYDEGTTIQLPNGNGYRLPTEAEWEFACRAGATSQFWIGETVEDLENSCWFAKNAGGRTHAVAELAPNPFGLFDVHGNVWEWTEDSWVPDFYLKSSAAPAINPSAGISADLPQSVRGGGWHHMVLSSMCRSAMRIPRYRDEFYSSIGFRVMLSIDGVKQTLHSEPAANDVHKSLETSADAMNIAAPPNESLKYSSQIDGATKEQLIEWSGGLPNDLRPSWISARATESGPVFYAVAVASPDRSNWNLEFYDTNSPEQLAMFETHRFEYRMELIHEYDIATTTERLVVWSNNELAHWWHGDQSYINDKIYEYLKKHRGPDSAVETFLPHSISGRDGLFHFVPTWQPHRECEVEMNVGLDELSAKVEEYRQKGWRPKIIDSILEVKPPRYLAVFTNNPRSEKWDYSSGLAADEYHQQISKVDAQGGHIRCVCSRDEDGGIFYTVVWDYPDTPIAKSPPIADDDFQAIAPFNTARAKKYQEACAADLKLPVEFTNSIGMTFQLIPPGVFTIGSNAQDIEAAKPFLYTQADAIRPERIATESPQQVVTITKPFYLGTTEVTQSQFQRVTGANPSWFSPAGGGSKDVGNRNRPNAPVEIVTWNAAGDFCNLLSQSEKLESAYRKTPQEITQSGTGGYRLPTEAEWEYACRAGTTTRFWCGHSNELLKKSAWFGGNNPNGYPSDVAQLAPNPFGLYDMHGNVWEWVHDGWQSDSYKNLTGKAATNPRCDIPDENRRVIRGGDFFMSAEECRSACRDCYAADSQWDDVGFRVALSIEAVRKLDKTKKAK